MSGARTGSTIWDAWVFDFDGVLIDSSEVYRRALSEAVAPVSQSEWPKLYGMTTSEAVEYAAQGSVPDDRIELLSDQIDRRVGELLARRPPARSGARALLEHLQQAGIRLGVASSATRFAIDGTLEALGWRSCFDVIIGREDADNPKPFPDAYREAVRRLAARPEATCALEDTDVGVRSAKGAGLFVVALGGTQSERSLRAADRYFSDFSALLESNWFRTAVAPRA
jgi:HAD superfamily hydrolase (TIGR01509 family)